MAERIWKITTEQDLSGFQDFDELMLADIINISWLRGSFTLEAFITRLQSGDLIATGDVILQYLGETEVKVNSEGISCLLLVKGATENVEN